MKKLISKSFSAGGFTYILMYMAVQDFMGKEKYIEWIKDSWVNIPWWLSVWFGIAAYIFYQTYQTRGKRFIKELLRGKGEKLAWEDSKL